ncbi:MAG: PH domain-containing protein [Micromonosporaceae bacterium]|nr:PH domain-containing protein [Micromonosporaceae bacterium]
MKLVGALIFVAAALLLARNPEGLLICAIAAAAIGAYALRDLLAPVRLAADGTGLTVVSGYAALRRIPWSQVERIRIDARQRLGLRSELLEIDAGSSVHLFSSAELGAPVEQVADALRTLRTGR